ncbi:MAG: PEGA domain-containing protein [Bacteroidales bacterium]|nr:PEGA domain-containing protein [Bacteroidales bacterium]
MKTFLSIVLTFLLFVSSLQAQIAVESFRVLPTDQTARITDPVIDQNGDKCALIKVVTNQTGFAWEGGMLGITKVEKKTGEFWVYLPHGAKKITIKHEQLGVLRNYVYTEAIKEATVYEMVLTTGIVKTIVEQREIESVWLMINSTPSKSDLFIDDVYVGQTPFQKKMKKQKYNFRLSKVKYQPNAGVVDLSDIKDNKELNINLKPDFGSIYITTEPESGAEVILDDDHLGLTTPCTINEIKSGTHRITLRKKWYEPVIKEFKLSAEEEKSINVNLIPSFGELNITSDPKADIYIDNVKKGYGSYSCRLSPGIYSVKAQKPKHRDKEQNIEIRVGEIKNISFNLQPKYGTLDIASTPWNANITLNGKDYGKTPTTEKLLVGTYTVKLIKEGYAQYSKSIVIEEGQTESINIELQSGKKVTINSEPKGAKLYIDNEYQGETPFTTELSFGKHNVKLSKNEYQDLNQNIEINENTNNVNLSLISLKIQIKITSNPSGAQITVDDKYKGTTPNTIELPVGKTDITLEKKGYIKKTKSFDLKNNQTLDFKLPKQFMGYTGMSYIPEITNYDFYKIGLEVGWSFNQLPRLLIGAGYNFSNQAEDISTFIPSDVISINAGSYEGLVTNTLNIDGFLEQKVQNIHLRLGYIVSKPFIFALTANVGMNSITGYNVYISDKHYMENANNVIYEGTKFIDVDEKLEINNIIYGLGFIIPISSFYISADYWISDNFVDYGPVFMVGCGLKLGSIVK